MTDPRDLPNRDLKLAVIDLICVDPDDRTPDDAARLDALRAEYARRNPDELERAWRKAVARGDAEHAADLNGLRRIRDGLACLDADVLAADDGAS